MAELEFVEIESIVEDGEEAVYDLHVCDTHCFFANDILVHNCSEIGMSAKSQCILQTIDLRKFVVNPWKQDAYFDYDKFDKLVQNAQRLTDDIIDLELETIEKIIEKIKSDPEDELIKKVELDLWQGIYKVGHDSRRTGLGITAFADTLAMLGIKYGSQESIDITDKIYKALALGSYRSSVKMAEERGAFPVFEYDSEKDHQFLNRIFDLDDDLKQRWQKHGRRNIANLTTAPVGSLSTVLQCSSGIEPVFLLSYDRRRKINANDTTSKVDYVDNLGDKWQSYTIYHQGLKDWMNATGKTSVEESPYHNATSNDIDWMSGVQIQATAQKWVCHAISKCLVRDTLITTDAGLLYLDEIHNLDQVQVDTFQPLKKDINVLNMFNQFEPAQECYNNGIQNIVELICDNGLHLQCTKNERVRIISDEDGEENWVEVGDLQSGDRIKICHPMK